MPQKKPTKIVKTSEDGKVEGISFTVTGNGVNKTVQTGAGGVIQIDNLAPGVYTVTDSSGKAYFRDVPIGIGVYEMPDLRYGGYFVKETKAPEGFYLDENAYYFEITEHGKTVTVENEAGRGFVNVAQVGSLKIIKTSSDNKVAGFSFRVTGPKGCSEIFTTGKNGEILIENLRIGEYVVSEVSDAASSAYILPADKTASVFEGAVTKVKIWGLSAKWRTWNGSTFTSAVIPMPWRTSKKSKRSDADGTEIPCRFLLLLPMQSGYLHIIREIICR